MKHLLLSLFGCAVVLTSCQNEVVTRDVAQLPQSARLLVERQFAPHHISYIKIDRELFFTDYKVVLTNGDEVDFDADGAWKEVECKRSAVPEAFLPHRVADYLKQNFPTDSVEAVKRSTKKTKVELHNGLEVVFDAEGNFLRMDD